MGPELWTSEPCGSFAGDHPMHPCTASWAVSTASAVTTSAGSAPCRCARLYVQLPALGSPTAAGRHTEPARLTPVPVWPAREVPLPGTHGDCFLTGTVTGIRKSW